MSVLGLFSPSELHCAVEFIQCQHKYRREYGQVLSLMRKMSSFSKKEHKVKKKDLVLSSLLLLAYSVAKPL